MVFATLSDLSGAFSPPLDRWFQPRLREPPPLLYHPHRWSGADPWCLPDFGTGFDPLADVRFREQREPNIDA